MQGTTLAWTPRAAERHDRLSDVDPRRPPSARATQCARRRKAGRATPASRSRPASIRSPTRTGVRCDIYDHLVNVFGRDPATGYARRAARQTWGVQYGLAALNSGAITKQQFLDLNQKIGGYDNNGNYVATRTVGDLNAIRIAYETGRITNGGQGPAAHADDRLPRLRGPAGERRRGSCAPFHSFSMRERLDRANGNHDNQVMLIEDGPGAHVDRPVRRREPGAEPRA